MKHAILFFASMVLSASLVLSACAAQTPESKAPVKTYPMRGEVIKLDPEHQTATIKHEDIEGFMHAMTMDYGFRDKQQFARLHKGDRFSATLFSQGDDFWVGDVKPENAKPAEAKPVPKPVK